MHDDPGPYWDWAHYFDLLGKPFGRAGRYDKALRERPYDGDRSFEGTWHEPPSEVDAPYDDGFASPGWDAPYEEDAGAVVRGGRAAGGRRVGPHPAVLRRSPAPLHRLYVRQARPGVSPHGASVWLRTEPHRAQLIDDIGKRVGKPSTYSVYDHSARASTGQRYAVAERRGDWTAIWYLGQKAWFHNPPSRPTAIPARAR